jgi:hypothetical protein
VDWHVYAFLQARAWSPSHAAATTGKEEYLLFRVSTRLVLSLFAFAAVSITHADAQTKLAIGQVIPNDDSVKITVVPVFGAVDYRVYEASKPDHVKYSGGNATVEWNGIDPAIGADLVVEAVDRLGPYQRMLGPTALGDITIQHFMSINGHGDPASVPKVLARSDVFHVGTRGLSMPGTQVFCDQFDKPLNLRRVASDPEIQSRYSWDYFELDGDKWHMQAYLTGNRPEFSVFTDRRHLMTVLPDGGYVAYATLAMRPKAVADISGGRVLHATYEVDAHVGQRRWVDLFIAPAGDKLLAPQWRFTLQSMFKSGNCIAVSTHAMNHGSSDRVFQYVNGTVFDVGLGERVTWDDRPLLNGTQTSLDLRHRFDVYLSSTHIKVLEEGKVMVDKDLPRPLPFSKIECYFTTHMYHSALEHEELAPTGETYWYNYSAGFDERHWDNMGFEVLPGTVMAAIGKAPAIGQITGAGSLRMPDSTTVNVTFGNSPATGGAGGGTTNRGPMPVSDVTLSRGGQVFQGNVTSTVFSSPLEATVTVSGTYGGQPAQAQVRVYSATGAGPCGALSWVVRKTDGTVLWTSDYWLQWAPIESKLPVWLTSGVIYFAF